LVFTFYIGEIIACCTNCLGSWHDSRVAKGIYTKLENETPDGFSLVADSAILQGNDRVAGTGGEGLWKRVGTCQEH